MEQIDFIVAKGLNKSEAIREAHRDHPTFMSKEIAELLSRNGINVSAQFVSTVLSNDRRRVINSSIEFESADLIAAKSFVVAFGSFERAIAVLEAYETLVK